MRYLSTSLLLLFMLVVIVCGIYPLALWGIGQTMFNFQANGSMLKDATGRVVGSRLIAQPFTSNEYFQPRPSAAGYDASASASSALAASNPALRQRVTLNIESMHQSALVTTIPADMVTTSASGLDPNITLQNAELQLERVAQAWAKRLNKEPAIVTQDIRHIMQNLAAAPVYGLFGEKLVNVLELNLELQKDFG